MAHCISALISPTFRFTLKSYLTPSAVQGFYNGSLFFLLNTVSGHWPKLEAKAKRYPHRPITCSCYWWCSWLDRYRYRRWCTGTSLQVSLFHTCLNLYIQPGVFDFYLILWQVFGFLNLILWGGNCWFIYKETPFHKTPNQPADAEGAVGPS